MGFGRSLALLAVLGAGAAQQTVPPNKSVLGANFLFRIIFHLNKME